MKTLYNPTKNIIEVQILGVKYVVEANGTVTLPDSSADYWVHNLHQFMEVVPTVKTVKIPEEVIVSREEAVAELGEEVIIEAEASAEVSEEVAVVVKKKVTKKAK